MPEDIVKIARALISVSDKTGLVDLGRALTAAASRSCRPAARRRRSTPPGFAVVDVAQFTGFPEMMDGRVKTLHPRIHGGLLAIRADPAHQAAMIANDIAPIDLLIVNLYPVRGGAEARRVVRGQGSRTSTSAARRWSAARRRTTTTWPSSSTSPTMPTLLAELERNDGGDEPRLPPPHGAEGLCPHGGLRRGDLQLAGARRSARPTPKWRAFGGVLHASFGALRYGENPHQSAALYLTAEHAPGRRDRAAGPGQGTVLQQHQRHRRGLRTGRRIRSGGDRGGRDHQARQPLRRGGRRDACSRPTRRRWPATRSRRSAASWR